MDINIDPFTAIAIVSIWGLVKMITVYFKTNQ